MGRLGTLITVVIFGLLVYIPFGGWKAIAVSDSYDQPDQRTYGDVHDVPGFEWVTVLNERGVHTADTAIRFYEHCLVRYRGQVQEITNHWSWYSWWSDSVMVEYANPPESVPTGVLCPDHTVFFLGRDELAGYEGRYQERAAYEQQLRAEIAAALRDRQPGPAYPVQAPIQWVEVANPDGVRNFGYDIPFLDTCGIEAGGVIQAVHGTADGTLYEYTPDASVGFRGLGVPCPASTVFFLDGSRTSYF